MPREDTFEVLLNRAYFNDEGFYQLLVAGKPVGEPHDCFLHDEWKHGQWPVRPGTYEIGYQFTGEKNPKSAGTVLNLIWMGFA